ncbi:hypothetical protein V6N12_011518 [Hibiscus sabdariffa]|uniref:Uncharacterized protein n=1 Tax=Hibiscus sabdariffa TaxID=183260 RepID=A0ABR2AI30_9ROSI
MKNPGCFGWGNTLSLYNMTNTSDMFEDQTLLWVPFVTESTPLSLILRTPEESETEVSLLATHTIVPFDTFLYQIPRYRLFEFPGLKNPSSKVPPADTRVSPSLMDCPGLIVFSAKVLVVKKINKHRTSTINKASNFH